MIKPEQLAVLPEYIIKLWEELEAKMLKDIADKMKVKDVEQLLKLGGDKNKIVNELKSVYKKTEKEVEELLTKATKYSWTHDKEIADKLKKELPPLDMQIINAQMKQMKEQFKNITNTTGFFVNNKYTPMAEVLQKVSDNVYMEVVSGANGLQDAINKQMAHIADKGLVWVDYDNGTRRRVESTIRMSVITGVNQTITQITDINAEALGAEKYEVSAHIGARNTGNGWENHEAWQGKIYTKAQLHDICGLGQITGLCGINCRHTYHPFFEKVSKPNYTQEELANMRGKSFEFNGRVFDGLYEATQEQRKLEAEIRRLKRFKSAGLDVDAQLKQSFEKYRAFSHRAGLPTEYGRLKIFDINEAKPITKTPVLKTWKEKVQEIKPEKLVDVQKAGKIIYDEFENKANILNFKDVDNAIKSKEKEYDLDNKYKELCRARKEIQSKKYDVGYDNYISLVKEYNNKVEEYQKLDYDFNVYRNNALAPYKNIIKDKLQEYREIAPKSLVEKNLVNNTSQVRNAVIEAGANYPKDWWEIKSRPLNIRKSQRGHYNRFFSELYVGGDNFERQVSCAVHELGHHFEYVVPNLKQLEKEFYKKRTAGEELRWLGEPYDKNETSRFDKFIEPYMGKDYQDTAYELVSMGFQYAFNNPTVLFKDRDFAEFILGVLFKL